MFFTQEDYKKIYDWIRSNSIKDTEFNNADTPLKDTDTITLVQNNTNVRVSLKDFTDQLFLMGVSDFLNISHKYGEYYITLQQAIELIPHKSRKRGQVITFLDEHENWRIYQFRGEINQWSTLHEWLDILDFEPYIINSILPDEEDLTKTKPDQVGNTYLSLKDREYNPEEFSGMGRIILRKNIVEIEDSIHGKVKKNVLYQDMINKKNTIYEIRYDFTLETNVTIPDNCILKFNGGSINGSENNYKLIGTNTKIIYNSSVLDNIIIDGTWLIPNIYSWIFKDIAEEDKLRQLFNLCSEDIENNVYISKLTNPYIIVPKNNQYYTITGIRLKSNTNIYNNGIIKIKPNSDYIYCIFAIGNNVHNIVIDGGEYIGDNYEGEHDFTQAPEGKETEEFGCCFWSYRSSEFITIKNIYAHHFIGDFMDFNSKNVVIDNIVIHNNRRQGISICDCSNVTISNFEIYNIGINLGTIQGTDPRSAIDIEPNFWDAHNITIENGYIHDCYRGLVCSNSSNLIYNNTYKNIRIENISGYAIRHFTATDCVYDNIQIKNVSGEKPNAVKSLCVFGQCANISFINSSIIENSETFDSYAIQEVEVNNLIFDNLYINAGYAIDISKNNILKNSILNVKSSNGRFDKCTITILPSSDRFSSVVGIFKDCKLVIKNTIGWYIKQAINCDFYINDVLNSIAFTIMPNVNTEVVGCTFNVSANNTLFHNPHTTSKGALIDCVYNFTADNVNIGSNIERLFIGSGSTNTLNQINSNIINKGKQAFNTSIARPVFWNDAWKDANGFDPAKTVGNTSERPDISTSNEGFCYFDKTLNKPIWASKSIGDTVISAIITANNTTYIPTASMEKGKEYKITKSNIGGIGIYFVNEDESKSIVIIDSATQTESVIICPDTSIYTKIKCSNRGNAITITVIKMILKWIDATGAKV